jgi:hypothetical protein
MQRDVIRTNQAPKAVGPLSIVYALLQCRDPASPFRELNTW